jgi:hypothetical protein
LRLQVSVNDFPVMDMFHRQTYLSKPVQDLVLTEITSLCVFNFCTQVASICVVHYNIQSTIFNVCLYKLDDVRMIESLQNAGFFHCFFDLLFIHASNFDFLQNIQFVFDYVTDQVAFPVSAFSQNFYFL